MSLTKIAEPPDSPWDQQSLQLLDTLPKSGPLVTFLPFLKLVAVPFAFFGGIGTVMQLAPILTHGPEYENAVQRPGAWVLALLVALALLGIGAALWAVSEKYTFEQAPRGSLMAVALEGLALRKNTSKIRTAAACACRSRKGDELVGDTLAVLFAKAMANEIIAETSSSLDEGKAYAKKAIPLFHQAKDKGLNTPLLWFCLANSYRITEQNDEAITHYETYLELRPQDEGTRKIMEGLKARKSRDTSADRWEEFFQTLLRYVEREGNACPRVDLLEGDVKLGAWAVGQRVRYRDGKLDAVRARRLESVPGWSWDATVTRPTA